MVRIWCFIGVDVEGVVVAEDVLLDALIHISTHGQKVLRTIFVTTHLLNPRSISQ
jgi:hypothetical protein